MSTFSYLNIFPRLVCGLLVSHLPTPLYSLTFCRRVPTAYQWHTLNSFLFIIFFSIPIVDATPASGGKRGRNGYIYHRQLATTANGSVSREGEAAMANRRGQGGAATRRADGEGGDLLLVYIYQVVHFYIDASVAFFILKLWWEYLSCKVV